MKVVRYNENIITISCFQSLKIFCFAAVLGIVTLFKKILLKVLKISSCEWNNIDNPPSCLVDGVLGQHSYVKIKGKGIKLHYMDAGDKNKPTVLLLHGFPDCWISWFNQIPVLTDHFRVICLDLKGFGDSDKPLSRRSYKLETLLEELTIFISSVGVNKCAIIGHDIGALLGWYIVHLNPSLVSKFVAISCSHPNVHWEEIPRNSMFNNNWIQLCQLPYLAEVDSLKDNLSIIDRCYKHLKDNCKGKENEYIAAYKYTFSRKEDWTGALNYYRNLPFYRLEDANLREIEVPCLLITGKLDDAVTLESVVKSTEFIQRYTLKIIDDAAHYPHQENAEMVNKALLEFVLDPPLVRLKKDAANSSIFGKMIGSVSKSVKYSTEVLTGITNDPNKAVASLLSKN